MNKDRPQSVAFAEVTDMLLEAGLEFRFQGRGRSMLPVIQDGEILHVKPADLKEIKVGDIVLFKDRSQFKAHRVIRREKEAFVTRGDAGVEDTAIQGEQIVGKIIAKQCSETGRVMALGGLEPRVKFFASEGKRFVTRQIRRWKLISHSLLAIAIFFLLLATLISPRTAAAQHQTIGGVALDTVNSQSFQAGGTGTTCTFVSNGSGGSTNWNCSLTHTTTSGQNDLLLVGISMNNQGNGSDSQVTGVTYNGTSMGSPFVNYNGASPGTIFRVQIYCLKNPAAGTFTITAAVHKASGGNNPSTLVIGAMTLFHVDTTFGSLKTAVGSGTSTTASAVFTSGNAPGTNDGVIDVLSTLHGTTVTPNTTTTAPLVFENQQWDLDSGTTGQDVHGHGSSAGGIGAALTMQETLGSSTAWTLGAVAIPASHPTAVKADNFSATQVPGGILLSWRTSGEMHNLGFNVYREVAGQKVRVNPSLIAGSALLMRDTVEQHGAKTYGWIDRDSAPTGLYWLEDVDVSGTRTLHGPVQVEQQAATPAISRALTMQDLSRARSMQAAASNMGTATTHVRETVAHPGAAPGTRTVGFQLASQRAVKIFVDHEGWYHITQPQLVAAGLNPNAEARNLHLFAEGVEQPIRIIGTEGSFGPGAAIEFYGTAIDTPYTGQRVYWLAANDRPGKRIEAAFSGGTAGPAAQSFIQTIELKPRTTYFAALLKEDTDNFFGNVISPEADVETVNVSNALQGQGTLVVALQGVTLGQQHDVTVTLNGATLGSVNFADQQEGKSTLQIPSGVLTNGVNTITLAAQQGENDLSVLDYIDISFPHSFTAESDQLKFTAAAGANVKVGGFVQPPSRLIDITNGSQPVGLAFSASVQNGFYTLAANIPWTSAGTHSLLALSDAQLATPAAMDLHHPSNLHSVQPGADAVALAAPQFIDQVRPLASLRQAEGRNVALINVNDVYDEFNFGERTPFAIRDFLHTATIAWKTKPHYLVLGGDASVDPRDYLGFGFLDFVPTKIVITAELKTASDDWFSDFENTGFAKIATGRLPARTPLEMQTIIGKIASYGKTAPGTWANQGMMVADVDDPSVSFSQAALSVQKMLPSNMNVTDVFSGSLAPGAAQPMLLAGINAGKLLVNYNGHGSVEIWGSGLFNDSLASSLTNGDKLPLFVAMNCLNGFFHDVYTHSLAAALMLAPNGGAVSVWASSGLTEPAPQFQMNQAFVRALFSQPSITVGDAVLVAKSGIADPDVRKTFILFGDPMMRLKSPLIQGVGNINPPLLHLPDRLRVRGGQTE